MMSNAFETAFSEFLDGRDCDAAQEALFSLARSSFLAGWLAAGGEAPVPARIFQLAERGERR